MTQLEGQLYLLNWTRGHQKNRERENETGGRRENPAKGK